MTYLGAITLLVRDYDEAIAWFTGKLGFDLMEDTRLGPGKRWVVVAPPGAQTRLLLAQPGNVDQARAIGQQGGGRVLLFLHTDDFARDYAAFTARGVTFLEEPRYEAYGAVAVFEDISGNRWDLIELKGKP
jgi:catechol 2,3-dioxygenase-like lactoylglutathione lyase family enzyme